MQTISFIGFGNMAQAIAKGLMKHQQTYHISASAPSLKDKTILDGIEVCFDNVGCASKADVVFLAVKPHQAEAVMNDIAPHLSSNCLLISVAAGLSLAWLEAHCKTAQAIIRSMPNTPSEVLQGISALIANQSVSNAQRQTADAIFSSIGMPLWLEDETNIDAITALTGSGPAYVFQFIESLSKAAIQLGVEASLAEHLSIQTMKGAVALAEASACSASVLRQRVTSPNGVTAAALKILGNGTLDRLLSETLKAAKDRSAQMAQTYKK